MRSTHMFTIFVRTHGIPRLEGTGNNMCKFRFDVFRETRTKLAVNVAEFTMKFPQEKGLGRES